MKRDNRQRQRAKGGTRREVGRERDREKEVERKRDRGREGGKGRGEGEGGSGPAPPRTIWAIVIMRILSDMSLVGLIAGRTWAQSLN